MKAVIQRVSEASVSVKGEQVGAIKRGLCVLVGIGENDTDKELDWMVKKITQMRIFSDTNKKMNLSLMDVGGDLLLISQFTLMAQTKKGNRPSFITAAKPDQAKKYFELFHKKIETKINRRVPTGTFGADMQVSLVNDGPVTIILDTSSQD